MAVFNRILPDVWKNNIVGREQLPVHLTGLKGRIRMDFSIGTIILRTFFALGLLLVLVRLMGRRSVAQLTLYDYVIGLVFGDIGAAIAVDRDISIIDGMVSLIACTVWIIMVNVVMLKSAPARKLVEAEPLMVIYNGCILEGNLQKSYYTVNSLLELLRQREIFDPGTVALAVLESDGELSIIKKEDQTAPGDTDHPGNTDTSKFALHMMGRALIVDGKITDRVSEHSGINKEWLLNSLKEHHVELEDIMVALITPKGRLYVDKKDDNLSW